MVKPHLAFTHTRELLGKQFGPTLQTAYGNCAFVNAGATASAGVGANRCFAQSVRKPAATPYSRHFSRAAS